MSVAPRTVAPSPQATGAVRRSRSEIRALTGLRIVAAVWVVLFHFHFTPLPGVADVVGVLGPLITAGAMGVDLFFVLSGFVIAYTYLDELGPRLRAGATARFVWARASRMWPLYALVFHAFGLWLVARLAFGHGPDVAFQSVQPVVGPGEWLEQVFMVQMWTSEFLDGASWVGPTWSISAEWLAYLLFPVTALVFFRMRDLPVPLLGLAALAVMTPLAAAYVLLGHPYYPWSWLVRILCGFSAGVLTFLVVRRLRSSDRTRRVASGGAVALPVVIGAGLLLGELAGPGRGGAAIVLLPLLVGTLALADRGPATVLSTRWAVHGGRISYALYLVHIPMFELYWLALQRFPALAPDTVLAHAVGAAVVVATIPVAALAFRLVEEPARRRMRALLPGRAVLPAGSAVVPEPAAPSQAVARTAARRAALGRDARCEDTDSGNDEDPGEGPRHAAIPGRRATLAAALINAQRRRPAHRTESRSAHERAEFLRGGHLQPGS